MNCVTCGSEIQPTFKHAILKNECPFCGGAIMDEETMALIEDVERTILNEATVREETAKKLAMTIVAKYNIVIKNNSGRVLSQKQTLAPIPMPIGTTAVPLDLEKIKIAPPSAYQQISKMEEPVKNSPILEMSKLLSNNSELSESERERILEEAVKEKYNMVNQATIDSNFIEDEENTLMFQNDLSLGTDKKLTAALTEASTNPVLEQERLARLARQQQALKSGSGAFRRS